MIASAMRRAALTAVLLLAATVALPASEKSPAQSADQVKPLLVGAVVPQVSLADLNGDAFDLKQAVSSKPSILVFYRGGW